MSFISFIPFAEKLIGLKFDNEDMYSKKNDPFILYGSEDAETQQAANKIEGLGYTKYDDI